jgi:Ni,Fe-hydrogenase I large subunit
MKIPKYPLVSSDTLLSFEFISEGNRGLIQKLVRYQPTNVKNLYNLAFGDKDLETGDIDDTIISNNGDSEKVLVTVVATLYAFTDRYPKAMIYVTGSTKARTRLYRMGISKYLSEITEDYEILGEKDDDWEHFKKDTEYEGFLVRRARQK